MPLPIISTLTSIIQARRFIVRGPSMAPAFQDGDCLLIDQRAYRTRKPSRGEPVVLRLPQGQQAYLKRIVGLPGEWVRLDREGIQIEGKTLEEPYISKQLPDEFVAQEWHLSTGDYLVLGRHPQRQLRQPQVRPHRHRPVRGPRPPALLAPIQMGQNPALGPVLRQPTRGILRKIRDDHVRPSPLDGSQKLQGHSPPVNPLVLGRRIHHCILATHAITLRSDGCTALAPALSHPDRPTQASP